MTREHAALLLGVDPSASAEQINHAWRVWAKLAHPDAGGDRQHFEALAHARALLLHRSPVAAKSPPEFQAEARPLVRAPLRRVCRRPSLRGACAITGAIAASILVLLLSSKLTDVGAAVAVGLVGSGWALTISRACLVPSADVGHRITALALAWIPCVTALVTGIALQGVDMIGVLPIVALPFVVVVALVNPGAGLWRPIRLPS